MEGRVVAEHQRREVVLPVQRGVIGEGAEVLCNGLVCYLSLAVALRVVGCRRTVVGLHQLEQILSQFRAEFLALVRDDFQRDPKPAEPPLKNGLSYSGGFFIGQRHKFHVLGKGICHTKHVLFVVPRRPQRPE